MGLTSALPPLNSNLWEKLFWQNYFFSGTCILVWVSPLVTLLASNWYMLKMQEMKVLKVDQKSMNNCWGSICSSLFISKPVFPTERHVVSNTSRAHWKKEKSPKAFSLRYTTKLNIKKIVSITSMCEISLQVSTFHFISVWQTLSNTEVCTGQ